MKKNPPPEDLMIIAMEAFWDAPGGNQAGVQAAVEAVLAEIERRRAFLAPA